MTSDWKTLQSDLIYQNPWIKLYLDKVKTRSGKTMQYIWYKSSAVAVIVPFLREDALVMIRQYRYPLRKVLLEFPAGHVENAENPLKAAKRELLEETGYSSKRFNIFIHTIRQLANQDSLFIYLGQRILSRTKVTMMHGRHHKT